SRPPRETPGANAAIAPALALPAVSDSQLLLFEDPDGTEADAQPRENGAQTAPRRQGGTQAPSEAAGGAEATGAPVPGAIPARCPVVGKPVCYYADCRHWQGERCAHPEALSKPRRRRRAAQ
ncbi:MAG: hypothetical protein OXI74_14180, partial [Rhodospirillaceae bacterium]|nr:hypothetical protein [Rhodospirillaceae bacterium]